MKRTYICLYVFIALIGLLQITGCVKLKEDLTGQPTSDKFFKSVIDFDAYIAGAYTPLFSKNFTFEGDYAFICESGAEDIYHRVSRWRGFEELNINMVSNPDDVGLALWDGSYASISIANTVIGISDTVTTFRDALNPVIAEARFLRGMNYFFLVRWFGEVPILTESNGYLATSVEQSSVGDVYDFIVEDLLQAEEHLPVTQTDPTRPTKGAARALLAKVYLTMAGFPLNKTELYAAARDKAKAVIDMNKYSLNENFADLLDWHNRFTNPELIFTFYANADAGRGSMLHMTSRPGTNGENGWGDWGTDKRFFEEFPDGPRKNATFYTTMIDGTDWSMTNFANPFPSKYRNAGPRSNYFTGPPNAGTADGYSPILRYADVLLIYAEAANMAENGPSPAAYDAINAVRERAGLDDLTQGLSMAQFDEAVINERKWELAFEHSRWFDLCRKHLVQQAMQSWYPNSVIDDHNYLLPKPQVALNLMKGIRQNPGY